MITVLGLPTRRTKKALLWTLFAIRTSAHTWIEQAQVIGANGSYVGDCGYARGFVDRADSRFDGYANKWQIPDPRLDVGVTRMDKSMLMCHPSQRIANYSSDYPRLQVVPGDFVALKYLENGHVTRSWDPEGKPQHGGTIWIYATHEPKQDEKLYDVLQWNASGSAGNGGGWLMASQDFDDGRCYQINASPESLRRQSEFPNHPPGQPDIPTEQWCETDILVDNDIRVNSTITVYWVWGWDTAPGTKDIACGKDEYYTSCLDLEVVEGTSRNLYNHNLSITHKLGQQDPQLKAVHNYKSRGAVRKTPVVIAEDACGSQSDTASTGIPVSTRTTAEVESPASSTAPHTSLAGISPTEMTANPQSKSLIDGAEEQSMTACMVETTTITITITSTVTIDPQ